MRVVFCGSGTFAVPTFEAIRLGGHDLCAAITQPPRPAGRGKKLTPTPIAQTAQSAGIETLPCDNVNAPDCVEFLENQRADVLCVVEFGQFLRAPVRDAARLDCVNLHGSLLPALRGAAPVNWAILRGLRRTGVSTFSLVDKMDAGAVYETAELDIGPEERAGELRMRLADLGAGAMLKTLEAIEAGRTPQPQPTEGITFAPILKKSDGYLDFTAPAEQIVRRVRGCWPWPGGRAVLQTAEGKVTPVTLAQARLGDGAARSDPGALDDDGCVGTGDGRLEIVEIQPAGKRPMPWRDFCNGHRVSCGDRFDSPEATAR